MTKRIFMINVKKRVKIKLNKKYIKIQLKNQIVIEMILINIWMKIKFNNLLNYSNNIFNNKIHLIKYLLIISKIFKKF